MRCWQPIGSYPGIRWFRNDPRKIHSLIGHHERDDLGFLIPIGDLNIVLLAYVGGGQVRNSDPIPPCIWLGVALLDEFKGYVGNRRMRAEVG